MGFVRTDLQVLSPNMILLFLVIVFLIAEAVTVKDKPDELLLVNVSYIMMSILASMGIMFKYSTEIQTRPIFFRSLEHIGYMYRSLKGIIYSEIAYVYGLLIAAVLIQVVNVMIADHISLNLVIFQLLGFLIPLLICAVINTRYYIRRAIGRR
jgi:hypothetical protein